MDKIAMENKISQLGGIRNNPLCGNIKEENGNDFLELEEFVAKNLPEMYKDFYKMFGPFSFNNVVNVLCIDSIPVSSNKKVNIDYFFSVRRNSKCSILKLLHDYAEQLPAHLLPICQGEPGDLVCINLNQTNYGEIFYWHHESPEGNDLFLIAKNFDDFLSKLEVFEDKETNKDDLDRVKINKISPDFLELLRKSGYGPKEDI